MAAIKKDPIIAAVEAVHTALKDLQADERFKVLTSVRALLEITGGVDTSPPVVATPPPTSYPYATASQPSRPISLVEIMQDKKPKTISQIIALFAYYREKCEGVTRFGRDDLEAYFPKAKQKPPGNYGRDFVEAVKKGWIHEDGGDSYLTSKGVEVVESGFSGEHASSRPARSNAGPAKKLRKKKAK